jgi:NADH:ubiquinone oxidoreductase subunit 6 (subunit J)
MNTVIGLIVSLAALLGAIASILKEVTAFQKARAQKNAEDNTEAKKPSVPSLSAFCLLIFSFGMSCFGGSSLSSTWELGLRVFLIVNGSMFMGISLIMIFMFWTVRSAKK